MYIAISIFLTSTGENSINTVFLYFSDTKYAFLTMKNIVILINEFQLIFIMYRSKLMSNLPWLILLPIVWIIINQYFGYINNLVLYLYVVVYGFITSFFISIYLKYERVILFLNKLGIENAPREYKIQNGQSYAGIVIIHNKYIEKKALVTYLTSPMLLIEFFRKESKPFKLLIDPDYEKFEKLVADQNCNELYIFGHGRLYRLIIGPNKEDNIWYRDFIGYPSKEKVVQLHCNHRDGFIKNRNLQSLTDILHAKTDFSQKGMTTNLKVLKYLLQKIE